MAKKLQQYRRWRLEKDPWRPYWMCSACYPIGLQIGHVLNLGLIYNRQDMYTKCVYEDDYGPEGKYSLLGGQGHGGDEDAFFKCKPELEEVDRIGIGQANDCLEMKVDPSYGHYLVTKATEQYSYVEDRDNAFVYWLAEQAAKCIDAWEKKHGTTVEKFYDAFAFHRGIYWRRYWAERDEVYKQEAAKREAEEEEKAKLDSLAKPS